MRASLLFITIILLTLRSKGLLVVVVPPLEIFLVLMFPVVIILILRQKGVLANKQFLSISLLYLVLFAGEFISGQFRFNYISEIESWIYLGRLGANYALIIWFLALCWREPERYLKSAAKAFTFAGMVVILLTIADPTTKTTVERLMGPLNDPNFTSFFMIIAANFAAYWAYTARTEFLRYLNFALVVLFSAFIFILLSRSAIMGLFISLGLLLFQYGVSIEAGRIYMSRRLVLAGLAGLAAATFVFGVVSVLSPEVIDKLEYRFNPSNVASQKDQRRQEVWGMAVEAIMEEPMGHGMGQMRHKLLGLNSFLGHTGEVHNIVLQTGGALGVVPMLFLLGALVLQYRRAIRMLKFAYRGKINDICVPYCTCFIGLLIPIMLFNMLYAKFFWFLWAAVSLSYTRLMPAKNRSRAESAAMA